MACGVRLLPGIVLEAGISPKSAQVRWTLLVAAIKMFYNQTERRTMRSQHLTLTQVGCATIISFLYSLAFVRKLHVIRSFSVSPDWAIRKWPGDIDLYLPLPP